MAEGGVPRHLVAGQWQVLRKMARRADPVAVLADITARVEQDFPRGICCVVLADAETGDLRAAVPGAHHDVVRQRLHQLACSPAGPSSALAEAPEAVALSFPGEHGRWGAWAVEVAAVGVRRFWTVPLRAARGGKVHGALTMFDASSDSPVSSEGTVLMEHFAALTAITIDFEQVVQQTAQVALVDTLTGLATRALLLDRLAQALFRARRRLKLVAVMFLDLDGFKNVNDTYGHEAGDAVLVEVAARVRRVVRPSDTVARIGGDEFVVVCEDLRGESDLALIVDRLHSTLAGAYALRDAVVAVGVSIGATLTDGSVGVEDVLHEADSLMYQAKRTAGAGAGGEPE